VNSRRRSGRRSSTRSLRAPRGDAAFSADRAYRYRLRRWWDPARSPCAFVLLNPSTADERRDDPTIRRCVGFARVGGFGSAVVVNLFALRATDPRVLVAARDPVGSGNDAAIVAAAREAAAIVIGWGAWGERFGDRVAAVRALLAPFRARLFALGWTRSGEPRHPLYLPRETPLRDHR
jgi:hypothetical protein